MIEYTHKTIGLNKDINVWDAVANGWKIRISRHIDTYSVAILNFDRSHDRIAKGEFTSLEDAQVWVEANLPGETLVGTDGHVASSSNSGYEDGSLSQWIHNGGKAEDWNKLPIPAKVYADVENGSFTAYNRSEAAEPHANEAAHGIEIVTAVDSIRISPEIKGVEIRADLDGEQWVVNTNDGTERYDTLPEAIEAIKSIVGYYIE